MANRMMVSGLEITGEMTESAYHDILTPDALGFIMKLERTFGARRRELLAEREKAQQKIDSGQLPDFPTETSSIRNSEWTVSRVPDDLQDRRVEITGPAGDRKMVINAFNSGAKVYMSDFEDANSPTWSNTIEGQINLRDAVIGTISYMNPDGRTYALGKTAAVLKVRPRGWHMEEKHVLVDGSPISAGLFDFGLFFFHNAEVLRQKGSGPYFYLPKIESYLEARLWDDVFVFAQNELGIPQGTIKVTVLIETIIAAFQMDEILYELRNHIAGLNCGRWDYIFSFIKKLRNQPHVILPDRSLVTMASPFMTAYSLLAIKTCHRRKAHCIGGMAAQIPVKHDAAANEAAMDKVRADKLREVRNGHDGTWVAHPALVPVAMDVFDTHMKTPNQVERQRDDVFITAADLLEIPQGPITEAGVRMNVSVGVQYLEAWLRGFGAVPINNLMEDVATAEISRAQLWQWIHHPKGMLEDGRKVTSELFDTILQEELAKLKQQLGESRYGEQKFELAARLFREMTVSDSFEEFLTKPGYEHVT
ncbi:malate synthase A [Paenibacillus abyssi]|uniref:Malate synthase n=1 Tax=Paenibacillus abyssi TaxID=1340531 RepID=A0A917FV95_9BACL|nr:malate synthase A [Paenibacillus abyssi]GGG03840.1 malate synthase [Paenibacillus abyssi]